MYNEHGLREETRHWSLNLQMRLDVTFIPPLRVANIGNVDCTRSLGRHLPCLF